MICKLIHFGDFITDSYSDFINFGSATGTALHLQSLSAQGTLKTRVMTLDK